MPNSQNPQSFAPNHKSSSNTVIVSCRGKAGKKLQLKRLLQNILGSKTNNTHRIISALSLHGSQTGKQSLSKAQ